jgi:hypothetical protein
VYINTYGIDQRKFPGRYSSFNDFLEEERDFLGLLGRLYVLYDDDHNDSGNSHKYTSRQKGICLDKMDKGFLDPE